MAGSKEKGSRGIGRSTGKDSLPVGKSWFLGIGINSYTAPLPALHNARKDIEDIVQLLSDRYELDEAITLFDGEATRNAIMDRLQHLDEQVGQHDKLIIYYAGHGHLDSKDRGYWMPSDAQDRRIGTYLHNTTIREFIAGIEARHTLLISDSCFSGALLRDAGNTGAALKELERDRSRWVISSGRQREKVGDGVKGGNSPFAASILRVLGSNQAAGLNTGLLYDQVLKLTRFNYEQTPQSAPLFAAGHEGGQYVFRLRSNEQSIWEQAKAVNTFQGYNRYLAQFPHGKYADETLVCIQMLEDEQEWQKTERIDRISAYQAYLRKFGHGRYVATARTRISELEQASLQAPAAKLKPTEDPALSKPLEVQPNTFTDPRDGQTYKTVELNGQVWLAENLNFKVEDSWWYEDKAKNGEKYGRLYTWEAAKKACPPGWRLPTDEEWKSLAKAYGGYYDWATGKEIGDPKKAYQALIQGGSSGFQAVLGGWRSSSGSYSSLGSGGNYWSSTENDADDAWYYYFDYGKLYRNGSLRSIGFSCRCLKD